MQVHISPENENLPMTIYLQDSGSGDNVTSWFADSTRLSSVAFLGMLHIRSRFKIPRRVKAELFVKRFHSVSNFNDK